MSEGGDGGQAADGVKRSVVLPEYFTGVEEWTEWLESFETCASYNELDDRRKCKFILIRFKGNARKVLHDLDQAIKEDWGQLKDTLKLRFGGTLAETPELFKSEFLARVKKSGESYLEFGNAIRTLARKAYPTLDRTIRDELARDQFLRGLDKVDVALKVRHGNPKSLDEAIRMSVEWEAVVRDVERDHNNLGPNSTCSATSQSVGAVSHSQNDELIGLMKEMMVMMKEDRISRSGYQGYRGRGRGRGYIQSRGRGQGRGAGKSVLECWNCGGKGHIRSECVNGIQCWGCGGVGHMQANCTKASGNGN